MINMLSVLLISCLCVAGEAAMAPRAYSMYVWRTGWDTSVPGCDNLTSFLDWKVLSECFTPSYDTAERRKWLWDTCMVPDREVNELYLYVTPSILKSRNCYTPEVRILLDTLQEGHSIMPDFQIYALFSDGGSDVPEKAHVPDVVWFNENCAASTSQRFDGVSVNNEDYEKDWDEIQMKAYLENLDQVREHASKQLPRGSLKTHYSVGWHWGIKGEHRNPILITWNGTRQNIMRHFIDIFDSLDVQVAYVLADAMKVRMEIAEYEYAQSRAKQLFTTAYLSKTYPCQTTFFPFVSGSESCLSWSHAYESEATMFRETDALLAALPDSRLCLHYFRGAYSSGGHPDWPKHTNMAPSETKIKRQDENETTYP